MAFVWRFGIIRGYWFHHVNFLLQGLAYPDSPDILNQSKIGILLGSIVAGVLGYFTLKYSLKRDEERLKRGDKLK